jgi:hypothetical protein
MAQKKDRTKKKETKPVNSTIDSITQSLKVILAKLPSNPALEKMERELIEKLKPSLRK